MTITNAMIEAAREAMAQAGRVVPTVHAVDAALRAALAVAPPSVAAAGVPEGWAIRRLEDGAIVVSHNAHGGCVVQGKPNAARTIPEEVMHALASALLAAPALLSEPTGWRPISTAPRDGTRILAYFPRHPFDDEGDMDEAIDLGGVQCVTWISGNCWVEPDYMDAIGDRFDDDDCYAPVPTLWMPLPPAPAAAQATPEATGARFCQYNNGTCARRGCIAGCQASKLCAKVRGEDAQATGAPPDRTTLWLWKNGDHFLAFDNLHPCYSPGGDPMTLGEPAGRAVFRHSFGREAQATGAPSDAPIGYIVADTLAWITNPDRSPRAYTATTIFKTDPASDNAPCVPIYAQAPAAAVPPAPTHQPTKEN